MPRLSLLALLSAAGAVALAGSAGAQSCGEVAGRLAEPFPGLSMADGECAREKLVPLLERPWAA